MKANQLKPKIPIYYHLLFIVVTFIYWFSMYIYVPVFVPYLNYLGGSYALAGLIVGSYGIMQILLRLPVGILSDMLQIRKPFIILGLATSFISCLGFALTESVEFAFVSRVIAGITASMWVAFTVLYASYFKREDSTKAMGNIQFITVTAQLISMSLSGYLVSEWGWKAPFWFGAIIGLIGLFMSFWIKESSDKKVNQDKMEIRNFYNVFRNPLNLKASLLSTLAHAVLFITMFGFTPNQALNIGASKDSLIFLVLSFMVPHAIAPILTGQYLITRFNKWSILCIGFLGTSIFSIVIPIISRLDLLYVTQAFNGFFQGMTIPLLMGMAIQQVSNRKRATAMGFFQAIYALGIFFGPFIAGIFSNETEFKIVFYLAALLAIIGTGLSMVWYKQERLQGYQLQKRSKKVNSVDQAR
ncbi:MFS transporter [Priestia abyssalis]|uniref:MFS transporter n=1 Tax=Priestia abyssalis TaxID=1221450 RepID=UPI000994AE82|nr:MFS transporter [Priestia abyssalis]